MPGIKALSLDDAILLIESNSLSIGKITSLFHNNTPKNVIVSHSPASGHYVTEGTTVDLVLNKNSRKKSQEYPEEEIRDGFFTYRLEKEFLKRHIRIRINSFGISNDIIDDFMKSGEEIWVIIPKNNDSTVFVYINAELVETRVYD